MSSFSTTTQRQRRCASSPTQHSGSQEKRRRRGWMSKEQKDQKNKGKGGGAICMSREGIENQLVPAALKGATRKREISVHDLKMIRRHFHDDINIAVVCLQRHLGRHLIMVVE